MDLVVLSGTFATLVGLLANYKAERSGASLAEFTEWLREQHQDQMVAKIDADDRLAAELKTVLAIKHSDLLLKLSSLTSQVASVARQIEGLGALASHLGPPSPLTTQADSIVKQLVGSGAQFAQQLGIDFGMKYIFIGGTPGELKFDEPRFGQEDLDALQASGLIRYEYTPKGARKLVATRLGFQYVRRADA